MCFAPQLRALFRDRNFQKWPEPLVFLTNHDIQMCFAPQRRALFRHLNFQKSPDTEVLCTFWLPNVLREKRRALFRHLNFQKSSDTEVFWLGNVLRATTACTFWTAQLPKVVRAWCVLQFWLRNVLRATTACTCSTSQLPKVVRPWCALYILTWKCASRHNGVQFFITHLASWLCTRRFSEPTFRPSGQIIGKTPCFATFLPFRASAFFFFLLFLFSTLLSSNLSLLSASSLLCFSSVHIVGTLTYKLPSITIVVIYHYITFDR